MLYVCVHCVRTLCVLFVYAYVMYAYWVCASVLLASCVCASVLFGYCVCVIYVWVLRVREL